MTSVDAAVDTVDPGFSEFSWCFFGLLRCRVDGGWGEGPVTPGGGAPSLEGRPLGAWSPPIAARGRLAAAARQQPSSAGHCLLGVEYLAKGLPACTIEAPAALRHNGRRTVPSRKRRRPWCRSTDRPASAFRTFCQFGKTFGRVVAEPCGQFAVTAPLRQMRTIVRIWPRAERERFPNLGKRSPVCITVPSLIRLFPLLPQVPQLSLNKK